MHARGELTNHNSLSNVAEYKLSFVLRLLLKQAGTYCYKKADAVICVSKGVSKEVQDFFHYRRNR